MCRTREVLMLVLCAGLAAACGQAAALPSSGAVTSTRAPTYTLYPTYTPFPTYTRPSLSADFESLIWPKGPRDDVIAWTDAADFLGSEMIVEGTVVRTFNSGNAVFLNFVEDYPGTFGVVIFPEDWGKFPRPPEILFYGRQVRVEGWIEQYQGAPEIVVRDPWQIEIALTLGQDEVCECGTPVVSQIVVTATPPPQDQAEPGTEPTETTGVATVPPPVTEVVNWREAAAFAGQAVTVEGQVISTHNSGKVVYLNFDSDYQHTFKVVIFPDAWPLFSQPPEDLYRGKTVQVTGWVKMYQGAPEIIVDSPDVIQILE